MLDAQIGFEQLKQRMRGAWVAGDFGQIARHTAKGAEDSWIVWRFHVDCACSTSPVAQAICHTSSAQGCAGFWCRHPQIWWSRLAKEPLERACKRISKKATQSNYLIQIQTRSSIS